MSFRLLRLLSFLSGAMFMQRVVEMRRSIPVVLLTLALAGIAAAGWLPEERLTARLDTADYTSQNNVRCVAADREGNIHVVWYGRSGASSQVWYTCWDAQTGIWSQDTVISAEPDGACYPAVAVDDSGNVHVVWQVGTVSNGTALHYRKRDGVTRQWGQAETIVTGVHVERPSVAAGCPDSIAAAWEQQAPEAHNNVFAAVRRADGWSEPALISEPCSYVQGSASVGTDTGGGFCVLWRRSPDFVLCRRRVRAVWLEIDTVFQGSCTGPCVWVEKNGVTHAIWTAQSSGRDVHVYRQRREDIWSDTVALPLASNRQEPASLCADKYGQLHAVWVSRDTLYYTTSDSSGENWSTPVAIAFGPYSRTNPSINAGSGTDLQVVWTDNRNTPYLYPDIYCRRKCLLRDIEVKRIVSPNGIVDSGAAVVPAAWMANLGETTEVDVRAWFRVGASASSRLVDQLLPSDSVLVVFDTCVAAVPGWVPLCCSTALAGDMNRSNNVVRDTFFVRLRDLALDTIVSPAGMLPLDTVRPCVTVRNRGNIPDTAVLSFCIRQGDTMCYSDSLLRTFLPGGTATAAFKPWFGTPGVYTARCTLACIGDIHPENDYRSVGFELYWRDIGVESVVWPPAELDSGASGQPAMVVRNRGSTVGGFKAFVAIGADYLDSLSVGVLAPGQDTTLEFRTWTALGRGFQPVACSVWCGGDMNPANNVRRCDVFVRVRDVAAERILSPSGTSRADTVVPKALVRNRGNSPAEFYSVFCIESESADVVYGDTVELRLDPGHDSVVGFKLWSGDVGRYRAACKTVLAGDMQPENDTASTWFTMYRLDVRVVGLLSPPTTIDSGWFGQPAVRLQNASPVAASCVCSLYIGPYYGRCDTVEHMLPGELREVSFAEAYYALQRGWQPVLCSILGVAESRQETRIVHNLHPACHLEVRRRVSPHLRPSQTRFLPERSNDKVHNGSHVLDYLFPLGLCDSVFVRVRDASTDSILVPAGNVGRGEMWPQTRVVNRGNVPGETRCWFTIGDSTGTLYCDSASITMAPEKETVVVFSAWQVPSGRYWAQSWVVLDSDAVRANDTARAEFRVLRMDAAVQRIEQPTGRIVPGGVTPEVVIENLGEADAVATVSVAIGDTTPIYRDTVKSICVPLGARVVATFREWQAAVGSYRVFSRVVVTGDENPVNDTASAAFSVESIVSRRWTRLADVPAGAANRSIKDGGGITALPDGLFCLKGGNSDETYRYFLNGDSWVAGAVVPCDSFGRKVKSGAALCADAAGHVFALRGGRTRDFLMYDVAKDSWCRLPDLPAGTRLVKYGSGLAFIAGDTGRVFFVKGSGTLDFLVYWVEPRQWHARRWLPSGPIGKPARHGTCLAALGKRVFCLKGGTNEFYEYFPNRDSWHERTSLPPGASAGSGGRVRRGAALCASQTGYLYAFKGRSNEFWRYDPQRDSWEQLEDIPRGTSGRRVGKGAGLAWVSGRAYSLKGNATRELWCFDPVALGQDPADLSDKEHGPRAERQLLVGTGASKTNWLQYRIYDATGRIVRCKSPLFDYPVTASLRSGLYFVVIGPGRVAKLAVAK